MNDDKPNLNEQGVGEGPGPEAAAFHAPVNTEQAPLEVSQVSPTATEKPPIPESEWPNGVRKSIEVNGRKWEYLEYGNPDGIPILNVHGWLGASAEGNARLARALTGEVQESQGLQNLDKPRAESSDEKQPHGGAPKGAEKVRELTRGLKGKYHVITPELPGFGKTPELDDPTLDNMTKELADFQRALIKKPAVVFGSSAGAILATKMALHHPDLVRTLVLQSLMVKPFDMAPIPLAGSWAATRRPVAGVLERMPDVSKGIFKAMVSGDSEFKGADAASQKLILDSAKEGDVPTMLRTLRNIASNIEDEVAKVQAPAFVLDGTSGGLVKIEVSKRNVAKFHPEAGSNLGQKIAERKVLYSQVGGAPGEHAHNVLNSAPEEMAVLINNAVDFFEKEGNVGGRGPKGQMERPAPKSRLAIIREKLSQFTRIGR